jgi:hypothetical protein
MSTDQMPEEVIRSFKLKYFSVYFICLCGVICHVLLLVAFAKDPLKCFRHSATYLVANLAVCDLTVSLLGPFVLAGVHWSLNLSWQVALCGSLLTIASITVDRYVIVAFPFKHHILMNGKKILIWITLIWIASIVTPVNTFLHPTSNVYIVNSITIYLVIAIMFGIVFFFVLTSLSLRKQARKIAEHNTENRSNRTLQIRRLKEKRFLNTILCITCAEVIGIVPCSVLYEILMRKGIFFQRPLLIDILWVFLLSLYYFTFAINPVLYFLRLPNYRKTFFVFYRKLC